MDPNEHKQVPIMQPVESPSGFSLRSQRTLSAHIGRIAWSPDGEKIACPCQNSVVHIWNTEQDKSAGELVTFPHSATCVAWSPLGEVLVAGAGPFIHFWNMRTGDIRVVRAHSGLITSLKWSREGNRLVSTSWDKTVRIWDEAGQCLATWRAPIDINAASWDPESKKLAVAGDYTCIFVVSDPCSHPTTELLREHSNWILDVAWTPDGVRIATGSRDATIGLWRAATRRKTNSLEGHSDAVSSISFSHDGRFLASKSLDGTLNIWRCDTWDIAATLNEPSSHWPSAVAFHPSRLRLASVGSHDCTIKVWDIDANLLAAVSPSDIRYTTAKIVLVGDSGVGKTGLGWRLAHGGFKEHSSTHGQQFWILNALSTVRNDGTECEAILWDLAGQPDYRIVHALFLDDADLALVLFNPTARQEPLSGVEYWVRALRGSSGARCGTILVGARIDRGDATLTTDELEAFCVKWEITGGYVATSALRGDGIDQLIARMTEEIVWDDITATSTTAAFREIKDFILNLKAGSAGDRLLLRIEDIQALLNAHSVESFTVSQISTALQQLAKHGYVQNLRTASGTRRILLAPDLLNNLAASLILEARRNPKGLGALDEAKLVANAYDFPELRSLAPDDRQELLDSAVVMFLERNLCFREVLGASSLLIFPELINRRRPAVLESLRMVEDAYYIATGAVENTYAALVVLLGYTNTFARTEQWYYEARYEIGPGDVCGFRLVTETEGRIELLLYFSETANELSRAVFKALFEKFLGSRRIALSRYDPLRCTRCGYVQRREEVVARVAQGDAFMFCSDCGKRNLVPGEEQVVLKNEALIEGVALATGTRGVVARHEVATALMRTRFETAVTRLIAFLRSGERPRRSCFISYAWGEGRQEQWVANLATDLNRGNVEVVFDRWANSQPGSDIARFISRIAEVDVVLVVGTPLYLLKYENEVAGGAIVASEMDLIGQRLTGTEARKQTVIPLLVEGEREGSFPPLLRGRVYVDFRYVEYYFLHAFQLLLAIHGVDRTNAAVADLCSSLEPQELSGTAREVREFGRVISGITSVVPYPEILRRAELEVEVAQVRHESARARGRGRRVPP